MEQKEKRSGVRATQVAELNRILKERVVWRDVMTPELIRAINRKKDLFLEDIVGFIKAGGKVPEEVARREIHLVLPGHSGHPSPLVAGALLAIDWGQMTRENLQVLIADPKETGRHFTFFLSDWGRKNG